MTPPFADLIEPAISVLEIVWVNIVLSGDNAVVIALACRGLPPERRRAGMFLGASVAIVMRLAFTIAISALLATPFVKMVGGVLLVWIGASLLDGDDEAESAGTASERLWVAVRTVAIADAVMSLDNVLAIAAVANGSTVLLVLGLVISIPLIVAGAATLMAVLDRMPALVWAGAILIGWLGGEMIVTDPFLVARFGADRLHGLGVPASIAGAAFVVAGGLLLRALHARARRP